MTVKDYIFLQTSYMQLKYSNINCAEWWIPAKKVPDLNCEVRYVFVIRGSGSQTRGAGSEIGRIPPPNLTPARTKISAAIGGGISSRPAITCSGQFTSCAVKNEWKWTDRHE